MSRHKSYLVLSVILALHVVPAPASDRRNTLKSQLKGTIYMGDFGFMNGGTPSNSLSTIASAGTGAISGIIINVTWAQLQPSPDKIDTSAIDSALSTVRKYNERNPKNQLQAGLRIFAGANSPAWVKNLNGLPVTIYHRGVPVIVGPFWSERYLTCWKNLQDQLARKYDEEPLIHQVTDTLGSSRTDEPFNLPNDSDSIQKLLKAGFTDHQYQYVLSNSPKAYASWRTTLIDYPFNGYRQIDSGKPHKAEEVTLQIMRDFRNSLGAQAILSNHGFSYPPETANLPIFTLAKSLGGPIDFQAVNSHVNLPETINYALSLGSGAFEFWGPNHGGQGFTAYPQATLEAWNKELQANDSHGRQKTLSKW